MPNKDTLIHILLGRYIMAARLWQQMKKHYDDQDDLPRLKSSTVLEPSFFETKTGLAMGLWLGALYVVIEGWQTSNLSDPEITQLLKSGNVSTLRRFRNWLFHFQPRYLDERITNLAKSTEVIEWVVALSRAFERYFLAEMERIVALK
jgi:hypothetical protein